MIACGDNKLMLIATKSVGNYSSDCNKDIRFPFKLPHHDSFILHIFSSSFCEYYVCASDKEEKYIESKQKAFFLLKRERKFSILPVLCKSNRQSQMFHLF